MRRNDDPGRKAGVFHEIFFMTEISSGTPRGKPAPGGPPLRREPAHYKI
jgi:hypothetical protein